MRRHARSNIPAVRSKMIVAQTLRHQTCPQVGNASSGQAWLRGRIGKAVTRQRRYDHVEGIRRIAAMTARIGQEGDDLVHLVERSRPAVRDDDRHWMGATASLMDEVNMKPVYLSAKVRKNVDGPLLAAPIEGTLPVG